MVQNYPFCAYLEILSSLLDKICAKTRFLWLNIRWHHLFPWDNSVLAFLAKNALGQSDPSILKSRYHVNRQAEFSDLVLHVRDPGVEKCKKTFLGQKKIRGHFDPKK